MKRFLIFLVFASLVSCGSMSKTDRKVRRADFFNRFSKTEVSATRGWKMGDDILILRKNNSFRYYSKVMGMVNSGYFSGTYSTSNDSITFVFKEDHNPPLFLKSNILVYDKEEEWTVLRNSESDMDNYTTMYVRH